MASLPLTAHADEFLSFDFESAERYVAEYMVARIDDIGRPTSGTNFYSMQITHNYAFKEIAESLADNPYEIVASVFWNKVNSFYSAHFKAAFSGRSYEEAMYETILLNYISYHGDEGKIDSDFGFKTFCVGWDSGKYIYDYCNDAGMTVMEMLNNEITCNTFAEFLHNYYKAKIKPGAVDTIIIGIRTIGEMKETYDKSPAGVCLPPLDICPKNLILYYKRISYQSGDQRTAYKHNCKNTRRGNKMSFPKSFSKLAVITVSASILLSGCNANTHDTISNAATNDLAASSAVSAAEPYEDYRSVIKQVDYGDQVTYVIGHKSPDADTVGSAIAYANLLNELGIEAEAAISAKPNCETAYALKLFNYETPQIIDNADGKQFVLVDHSEYSQAIDNMENARVVGIIDHHGIGNVTNSELIYVRSAPMGSTASIIYYMYKENGVEITKDMARIMLMSLISDTSNGTKKMTKADTTAYAELVSLADTDPDELYAGMVEARLSYEGMSDSEIFMSDYKEYEIAGKKIGMACVTAANKDSAVELSEKMYEYMRSDYDKIGMDMLFLKVDNNDESVDEKAYMVAYGDGAAELLNSVFGNYDGELLFTFDKSISRKTDVIPAITSELEKQ